MRTGRGGGAHQVRLRGLLEGDDGRRLEAEVGLEVLRDLAHQALEGQLADQQLCRLLVAADLTEGNGARAVAVRLLDATGRRCRLACRFRRELCRVGGACGVGDMGRSGRWLAGGRRSCAARAELRAPWCDAARERGTKRLCERALTCLRGALPPVLLRAVCLVRAMVPGGERGAVLVPVTVMSSGSGRPT